MEFLVEFEMNIPGDAPDAEVRQVLAAEAEAAAQLAREGRLVRLWRTPAPDERVLGLYRSATRAELDGLLQDLPMARWMIIGVTPLEAHPNDPGPGSQAASEESS
jgi:muconolactone D-isomerase